jgi:hypothetical protein
MLSLDVVLDVLLVMVLDEVLDELDWITCDVLEL